VAALGQHLMREVGRLIPVLPVPLVATVLLRSAPRALSELELKSEVARLVQQLGAAGARLYVPRSDWDYAVGAGLRMLVLRRLVQESNGLFVAVSGEHALLRYYANSIAHLPGQDAGAADAAPPDAATSAATTCAAASS
jgi:glycerol-3-phosphate O-acyltransferase